MITVDMSAIFVLADKVSAAIKTGVGKLGTELQKDLIQDTPVKTGKLAAGWTLAMSGTQIVATNSVPYAVFVVEGTNPHVIMSKNGGVLAFQNGGSMVFTRSVHHPGTKANDFPSKSANELAGKLNDIINQALQEGGI